MSKSLKIKGEKLVDGSIQLEHPLSHTRPAWTSTNLKACDHLHTARRGVRRIIKNYYVKSGGFYHGWK